MAGDTVQQVKDKLGILDVVGQVVKLKKAGRSYVGLCPFHKEKSPSFHVSIERNSYHCFGCGEGGDIFTFIEKTEGVDFKGALKILAERAGVPLEYSGKGKENKDKLERLREAMNRAAQFYQEQLVEGGDAYNYARSRGLTAETIKNWGLGFAPDDWRKLLEQLTSQGFTVPELAAAGLVKEAEGKAGTYYDRFRNRLIFPIRDGAGRVVAFTGRALAKEEQAKYLNSPETDLYHKSELLFGLDKAKDAIRTRGFAILMEGQMDLLHAHQAGFENTVALSGTALTERHVALAKRYSENLLLALDADSAGLTATLKSALLALGEGMRVKAARLPAGKDPADVINEDAQDFAKRVKEAKPIVEFFLAVLSEREREQHKLVLSAERVVLPLIAAVKSPMEREHFVGLAARALTLSPEAVRESVMRVIRSGGRQGSTLHPNFQGRTLDSKPLGTAKTHTPRELLLRAVIQAYPDTPLASRVESEYIRITEAPLPAEAIPESALFDAEESLGEDPSADAADDLLDAFEEAYIREAYQEAIANLRRAESAGDPAALAVAAAACTRLSARLASLH